MRKLTSDIYGAAVCEGEEEVATRMHTLRQSRGGDASISTRVHRELSSKDSTKSDKIVAMCSMPLQIWRNCFVACLYPENSKGLVHRLALGPTHPRGDLDLNLPNYSQFLMKCV